MGFILLSVFCLGCSVFGLQLAGLAYGLHPLLAAFLTFALAYVLVFFILLVFPDLNTSVTIEDFFLSRRAKELAWVSLVLQFGILPWVVNNPVLCHMNHSCGEIPPPPIQETDKSTISIVIPPFRFFEKTENEGKVINDISHAIEEPFVKCPGTKVVARDQKLGDLLKEPELNDQLKDIFDAKTVDQIKLIGASHMLLGTVSPDGPHLKLLAGLYNIKSGVCIAKESESAKDKGIIRASTILADKILRNLNKIQIEPYKIISDDGSQVQVMATGRVTCLPEGWSIWTTVQPNNSSKHFLQHKADMLEDGQSWRAPGIFIGQKGHPEDADKSYSVYALLATPDYTKELSSLEMKQDPLSPVGFIPPEMIKKDVFEIPPKRLRR